MAAGWVLTSSHWLDASSTKGDTWDREKQIRILRPERFVLALTPGCARANPVVVCTPKRYILAMAPRRVPNRER